MMYHVYVGNIGLVYSGDDVIDATTTFNIYRDQSARWIGRAGGEDVTLMENGFVLASYIGDINNAE